MASKTAGIQHKGTSASPSGGVRELFNRLSGGCAKGLGTPWAFVAAAAIVLIWGLTGPLFHYSDTWQLVINTGTTIVTFLMVFLIQNTQNRDAKAMQLKLDEIIRAMEPARNSLISLETMTDEEIERLDKEFQRYRNRTQDRQGEKRNEPRSPGASQIEKATKAASGMVHAV